MLIRGSVHAPDVIIQAQNRDQFDLLVDHYMNLNSTTMVPPSSYLMERLLTCTNMVLDLPPTSCPLVFDSWSCFNYTTPGEEAQAHCPAFPQLMFSEEKVATKYCTQEGRWWVHGDSNRTWSNYTGCMDKEDMSYHTNLNQLHLTGLLVSTALLILSLVIFTSFPR